MVQDRATHTRADQYAFIIYRTMLSNLERPLITLISRSRHSLMLNVSQTVRDADIVPMEYYRDLQVALLNSVISNDLESQIKEDTIEPSVPA